MIRERSDRRRDPRKVDQERAQSRLVGLDAIGCEAAKAAAVSQSVQRLVCGANIILRYQLFMTQKLEIHLLKASGLELCPRH
jgi:hypothetical protein